MPDTTPAIRIVDLAYRYGERRALAGVSFDVQPAEIFALLGPNGSGKTTMFRILSTLVPPQEGRAEILGLNLQSNLRQVRSSIGVVFQSPSLDQKLTVNENLQLQAALYGLSRDVFRERRTELLDQLGLADRRDERVQTLSGGLRRRVELAKGMLHRPQVLLMDEPSTGLDPGARNDLWTYLQRLRDQFQITVALTTHLLEEAAKADRIGILDGGHLVALDPPEALCQSLGGDSITIETEDPQTLAADISSEFEISASVVDGHVRFESADGHPWVPKIIEAFPGRVHAIRLGRPTLEDVFIQRTGHGFWNSAGEDSTDQRKSKRPREQG
jgi:ABC-2 type transport system ATP-binding protein